MTKWGSVVEVETRRRIILSIAAYSYELKHSSIMTDYEFDEKCKKVDLSIDTGNKKMDAWFREEFDPCTGQWIYRHPELSKIEELFDKWYIDCLEGDDDE